MSIVTRTRVTIDMFACHSHHTQLSPSEISCVYQRGQALYSVDSVMAVTRSVDGGKTWSDEGLIQDSAGDDYVSSYHGPTITRMSDGTLVIIAMRIDRSASKPAAVQRDDRGHLRD